MSFNIEEEFRVFDRLEDDITAGIRQVFDEADLALVAAGEAVCPGARFPARNTEPLDLTAEANAYAEYRWGKHDPEADRPVWWSEQVGETTCVTNGRQYFYASSDPGYEGWVCEVFCKKDGGGNIVDVIGVSGPEQYKHLGPLLPGEALGRPRKQYKQIFWD